MSNQYTIAVLPGDGIGPEITQPCIDIINQALSIVGGVELNDETLSAGTAAYLKEGAALSDETLERAKQADAILLAAMGLPDIRYPDGTEIVPQIELREKLNLYAGVRPVRSIKGAPVTLANPKAHDLDFVIIRESTEGLFAARRNGVVEGDAIAKDTMEITRETSERLFHFSFNYTQKRKQKGSQGVLTCVDKANVLPSMAFYRKIFDECAPLYPDVEAKHAYVDAAALNMVRCPWIFDVMVTENMYGDILSDLGAGLIGGMGMAPSADIGDDYAVFQPCHGSAPDIMGTGKANPTAMILSGAMLLEWLGDTRQDDNCTNASTVIYDAVDRAFGSGELLSCELSGSSGTKDISERIASELNKE